MKIRVGRLECFPSIELRNECQPTILGDWLCVYTHCIHNLFTFQTLARESKTVNFSLNVSSPSPAPFLVLRKHASAWSQAVRDLIKPQSSNCKSHQNTKRFNPSHCWTQGPGGRTQSSAWQAWLLYEIGGKEVNRWIWPKFWEFTSTVNQERGY